MIWRCKQSEAQTQRECFILGVLRVDLYQVYIDSRIVAFALPS